MRISIDFVLRRMWVEVTYFKVQALHLFGRIKKSLNQNEQFLSGFRIASRVCTEEISQHTSAPHTVWLPKIHHYHYNHDRFSHLQPGKISGRLTEFTPGSDPSSCEEIQGLCPLS
jgi:hypothetical protein